MTKQRFLMTLMKLAAQPTKYDNKTSRWAAWVNGRWLMDCCRSVKAVLWGFDFDKKARHGGAVCGKGYPDYTTEQMIDHCLAVSSDMKKDRIQPGELLWFKGHVGVYLGDGNVFECAPSVGGCAITTLTYQPWKLHGFLDVIDYGVEPEPAPAYELKKGEKLCLKDEPLYKSSTAKTPVRQYSGFAWLVDGKLFANDRVRVTFNEKNVGNVSGTDGYITWRWDK